MVNKQSLMDMEMDATDLPSMGWITLRSLACLVEKLKQLMDTPKQNTNEMEYKSEEVKKQNCAQAKAECLTAHQECFLSQMEMCIMWEIATLDLKEHSTEATIRQIIMNILDPANLA